MSKLRICILFLIGCSGVSEKINPEKILTVLQSNKSFRILAVQPNPRSIDVLETERLKIYFNRNPNMDSCMKALQFTPPIRGKINEIPLGLEFIPEKQWESITYSITILKTCEDSTGEDLPEPMSFMFSVRALSPPAVVPIPPPEIPYVQGIGVESQNCPDRVPAVGSSTGGNWNLSSCYWDASLPLLPASSYKFRGGDSGTGACGDTLTDNFKVLFSEYMDPASTIQGVRLKRNSVPPSNLLLAAHDWRDCSAWGCRVLVLKFSEMEASCNGSLFGTSSQGGDFNLQKTEGSLPGTHQYTLSIDSSTAKSGKGNPLKLTFYFTMEGN